MYRLLTILCLACASMPAQAASTAEEITYLACRTCHAEPGQDSSIPAIAGMPADDLKAAFARIAENPGDSTIMHRFTAGFSAGELDALATYISGLEGKAK